MSVVANDKPASQDVTLAWVNDEPITRQELLEVLKSRHKGRHVKAGKSKDFRGLLDEMINDRLIVQEALRMEMDQEKDVQSILEQTRNSLARQTLLKREVVDWVKLTEDEVKDYYVKIFETIHARQIIVKTNEEADEIVKELQGGADFEKLARERSIGPKAKKGGDLGSFPKFTIYKPLEKEVFALKAGEVSKPIPAEGNFHIVRLEERIPADPKMFDSVKDKVERRLRKEREKERYNELTHELKSKATIEVKSDLVEGITRDNLFGKDAKSSNDVVATVNGGVILIDRFRHALAIEMKLRPVTLDEFSKVRKSVLEKVIDDKLLEKEAQVKGLMDDPDLQRRLISKAREELKKRFIGGVVAGQITLTDEDLEAYYSEHKERYRGPGRVRLARLVVRSENEAKELREKILKGSDFSWLVTHKSEDDEDLVKKGGELGWGMDNMLDPKILKAIAGLSKGSVTQPIRFGQNHRLYYVMDREKGKVTPFDQVKKQVWKEAFRDRLRLTVGQWVGRLREASEIRLNEPRLKELYDGAPGK
jgi:peptidyl-prolyl cis-trans isomerase C